MNGWKILCDEYGEDGLIEMMEEDVFPGVCLHCGTIHEEVDPDCREGQQCECGKSNVISAMELMF